MRILIMGLASALTTALTGMQAAETQVDVAGNNLANSQTVGFKASDTIFATQFLQTQSLGSAPTAQATRNVYLQGTLTPSGALADTAGIVQSAVLGDSSIPRPDASGSTSAVAPLPNEAAVTTADNPVGGTLQDGANYQYEFT